MTRYLRSALLCGVVAVVGLPQIAIADESTGIETIVVTAEKRAENVQDVPISMVALQTADINKYNTSTITGLQAMVPNLFVNQSPLNDAIYMRGFGSSPTNFAFDQTVSLYQDGIYGGRSRQFMAPFFDISRVEVLRGPQGALLGKNTAAGAISIVTADPTSQFEGSATADYNVDRNGFDVYGFVSGPLTDDLSARLAVKVTDLDGYIPNTFNGTSAPVQHNQMGRLSLKWAPTDNFDITTKVEYGNMRELGMNIVVISLTSKVPLTDTQDSGPKFGLFPTDQQNDWEASTTANYHFGGGYTLTSITGYSYFKDDKVFFGGDDPAPLEYVENVGETFDQYSQELQLFSPTGQTFEWILGGYWDQSDDNINTLQKYDAFGGFLNGQGHAPFHQYADTISVFAQATYHITDSLRLLGSVRYTDINKSGTYQFIPDYGTQLSPPPTPLGYPFVTGHINNGNVDPSATVQYDVEPGVMVYATYARGSKAGGFVSDTATTTDATFAFKPERSTNYEVGTKGTFFDDRLVADVSLYWTSFKDLQVSVYNPNTLAFVTGNAASATSKGVEATVTWLPLDNLQFTANGAYNDAAYDNFPGASCIPFAANPPPCNAATNTTNLKGFPLVYNSLWTGNIEGDYNTPINDALTFAASVNAHYRSKYVVSTDYSPNYGIQNGYVKFDARIQIGAPDEHWVLALIGKNVTNVRTTALVYNWPLSTPAEAVAFLDETRTISFEAKYKF